jgi:hypothetical protein
MHAVALAGRRFDNIARQSFLAAIIFFLQISFVVGVAQLVGEAERSSTRGRRQMYG